MRGCPWTSWRCRVIKARQTALLAGQTALARKVFEVVPIQEPWRDLEIGDALRSTGSSSASWNVVRACLNELKDNGLIREPLPKHYQRVAITLKAVNPSPLIAASESNMPPKVNPVVSPSPAEAGALDVLAALSGEVINLADEIGSGLKRLAARIEEVALSVEAEREINAEAMAKVRQFQALLKSI